jgi:hypothetical protein
LPYRTWAWATSFFEGKRSSKHRNECLGIHHVWGLNIKCWRLTD